MFRNENPEITDRVISDALLNDWLLQGNKEVCASTRCIVDDGTTIGTTEDDTSWNLESNITNFFDIDAYPGGGVTYNKKRLEEVTMAQLDQEKPNWRSNSSGTPKKYYRRMDNIYTEKPIDSNAYDLKVYSVLKPNDFDDDAKSPFNELGYLEVYHYSMVLFLQKKAKMKISKETEEGKAGQEFAGYVIWMKKMLGGGKYTKKQYNRSGAYK